VDNLIAQADMADGTCSVDGCDRPSKHRGWCIAHYHRWLRKGDVGSADIQSRGQKCTVEGCDRSHNAHGYCGIHYTRLRNHGDPLVTIGTPTGSRHGAWRGEDVGYYGIHDRLTAQRGPAKQHPCRLCAQPATNWAYDHSDPNAKHDERVGSYSTDLTFYIPLCFPCHWRLDRWRVDVLIER
jgi:hypothetical protein